MRHARGEDDETERDVAALVAAAADGDEEAWGEIVDRFSPLLVHVIARFRLSRAELEDVAQTVWLRLVEHLGALREPRALPGWIATTARHEALRTARSRERVQPQDPLDEAWSARTAVLDDPDGDLERAERHAALLEAFGLLSARQRQLLALLAEDPPPSYAEINRRTGIPVGSIGPTRARALEVLREVPAIKTLSDRAEPQPTRRQAP